MRLLQPTFQLVGSAKELNLDTYDAIALAANTTEDGALLDSNPYSEQIVKKFGIDFNQVKSNWPDFTGKPGELIEIPISDFGKVSRVYILGVGQGAKEDLRKAGASLGRKIKGTGFNVLNAISLDKESTVVHAIAISLAQYGWNLKTPSKESKKPRVSIWFAQKYKDDVERATVMSEAVWNARDLIHTPSNIKDPAWMASQAKSLVAQAKSSALSVNVKSGRALSKFGGLLAVGNSAPKPGPRMIEVRYAPLGSKSWPHVVLVGKGITFDTGGISLKRPYDTMVAMKSDMAGAAGILAATVAMAKIKPKVRVTALLMCAENMVSGTAQRPSDVITHYGGTTVEVLDTDAEGRLVLADGLAYADLELDPDFLIDVATLTGAASLGLGKQYAAMYSRDEKLTKKLSAIGEQIGDRVWPMPLIDDYQSGLESEIADYTHIADKGNFSAGSVTAALFLEKFVGKRNWVHLDIAGPARSEADAGEFIKGGTGFSTRLLIEWLTSFQ
jgi:leucyl aminopeptidase